MQAPIDVSFDLARRRAEQNAIAAQEALKRAQEEAEQARLAKQRANESVFTEMTDTTCMANTTAATASNGAKSGLTGPKKKVGKPKMTAKEKKERSVSGISRSCLDAELMRGYSLRSNG